MDPKKNYKMVPGSKQVDSGGTFKKADHIALQEQRKTDPVPGTSTISVSPEGSSVTSNVVSEGGGSGSSTSSSGGGTGTTSTYTPPKRTTGGDKAYAALTPKQREAQDAKYIAANTKISSDSSSGSSNVVNPSSTTTTKSDATSVKTKTDASLSVVNKSKADKLYKNIKVEETAVSDSITASQKYINEIRFAKSPINVKKGILSNFSGGEKLSPAQIQSMPTDAVAGLVGSISAEKAREVGGSTKPPGGIILSGTGTGKNATVNILSRRGNNSTKRHTGLSYQDFLKSSGAPEL